MALAIALGAAVLACCTDAGGATKSATRTPAAPKPVASAAPAAPPGPLSVPQTGVELPRAQAVSPAALETEVVVPEPPPAPVVAPARPRRGNPAASQPAAPPASPPAATPAATPAPEPREAVQEVISPAELKRLQDQALTRRREVTRILEQVSRRRLTAAQQNVVATVRSFLALSEEAGKHNDPRQADALAERAQILAKELQSGK